MLSLDNYAFPLDVKVNKVEYNPVAIHGGEKTSVLYFDTNVVPSEVNRYLSQLTYIQTELNPYPLNILLAMVDENYKGHIVYALDTGEGGYNIEWIDGLQYTTAKDIYYGNWSLYLEEIEGNYNLTCRQNAIEFSNTDNLVSLTEFNGLPIGAENEKIKDIMSITPTPVAKDNLEIAYVHARAEAQDILPSSGYDGFSSVFISGDSNLKPENIKKDITVFGVKGTYIGDTPCIKEYYEGSDTTLTRVEYVGEHTLKKIRSYCFYEEFNLKTVVLPPSVTDLGQNAFWNCSSLRNINLERIESIGSSCLMYCALADVFLPKIKFIGYRGLYGIYKPNVYLGESLLHIDSYAFYQVETITYNGTIEQWNNVSKFDNWIEHPEGTQIICTDGTITL